MKLTTWDLKVVQAATTAWAKQVSLGGQVEKLENVLHFVQKKRKKKRNKLRKEKKREEKRAKKQANSQIAQIEFLVGRLSPIK